MSTGSLFELSEPIEVRKDWRFPGEVHARDVWKLNADGKRGLRIARLHYAKDGKVFLCFSTQIFDSPTAAHLALDGFLRAERSSTATVRRTT